MPDGIWARSFRRQLAGLLELISYVNSTGVFADDDLARVLVSTEKVIRAVLENAVTLQKPAAGP